MSSDEMLMDHVWVPFDAQKAGEIAVRDGSLTLRTTLTIDEIIEKYGDMLTDEEIAELKSRKS